MRVRQPPSDLGSDDWIGPREDSWQDRYINYDQTTREVNENERLFPIICSPPSSFPSGFYAPQYELLDPRTGRSISQGFKIVR